MVRKSHQRGILSTVLPNFGGSELLLRFTVLCLVTITWIILFSNSYYKSSVPMFPEVNFARKLLRIGKICKLPLDTTSMIVERKFGNVDIHVQNDPSEQVNTNAREITRVTENTRVI